MGPYFDSSHMSPWRSVQFNALPSIYLFTMNCTVRKARLAIYGFHHLTIQHNLQTPVVDAASKIRSILQRN